MCVWNPLGHESGFSLTVAGHVTQAPPTATQEMVRQHERDLQRHRVAQAEASKLLKQMHEQFKKVADQSDP